MELEFLKWCIGVGVLELVSEFFAQFRLSAKARVPCAVPCHMHRDDQEHMNGDGYRHWTVAMPRRCLPITPVPIASWRRDKPGRTHSYCPS